MNRNSVQFRAMISVAICLIAVAALIVGFSVYTTRQYFYDNSRALSSDRYQGMQRLLEIYKDQALAHVSVLAQNPQIMDAAKRRDLQALFRITTPLMKEGRLDYLVVTDPKGFALIRTHEPGIIPKSDDSIANQENIKRAISGKVFVGIEEGKVVKLSVRAGAPIYDESGALVGVLSTGYVISQNEIVDRAKAMFGGEFTLFLQNQRVATTITDAAGKRIVGTALDNTAIVQTALSEGKVYLGSNNIQGKEYATAYGPLIGASGKPIGIVFTGMPQSRVTQIIQDLTLQIVTVSAIALGLVILLSGLLARRMLKPLRLILENLHKVAEGNLAVPALSAKGQDELSRVSGAFNKMTENLRSVVLNVSRSADQVSASSQQLTANAEQSAIASSQVAETILSVANAASLQVQSIEKANEIVMNLAKEIESITSYSELMAKESRSAALSAKDGKNMATQAVEQVGTIESAVDTAAKVVQELSERSKEIGQIIDAISTIAGQTNLLALNAAIESARAGEAGRGFAVVAEEVRKLSVQAADSAQKITSLIGMIQEDANRAVQSMDVGSQKVKIGTGVIHKAGTAFSDIASSVGQLSTQVEEIVSAIQTMSAQSKLIVDIIQSIDRMSKETSDHARTVSAATEEQSATTEEIAGSCQMLMKMTDTMQDAIRKFRT